MDGKEAGPALFVGICFLGEEELHNIFMSVLRRLIEGCGTVSSVAVDIRTYRAHRSSIPGSYLRIKSTD